MTMRCDRFLDTLEAYVEDRMAPEERARWRAHLASCPRCRETALQREPSLLFVTAAPAPPAPETVGRQLETALAAIRHERIERRFRWGWTIRRAAAAAAVAALLGLGGLTALRPGGAGAERTAAPVAATASAERPSVELEMDGEVTVYQVSSADDTTTTVAFVVVPELKL